MTDDLEDRLRTSAPDDDAERAAERLPERAAAEGLLDVAYARVDSPVGTLLAAATERGLVTLAYVDHWGEDEVLERLAGRLSPRLLEHPARLDRARRELDEYFAGHRRDFELDLDLSLVRGFGARVLEATAAIPFGEFATYTEVATRAGSPRAVRAAGNALGANPIPVVVPCHRVLRTGGGLGGYTGGLEVKRFLLGLEGLSAG